MKQLKEGQTTIMRNQRALGDNSRKLARQGTWILGGLIGASMALNFYMFMRWEVATQEIMAEAAIRHEEIQSVRYLITQEGVNKPPPHHALLHTDNKTSR